MKVMVVNGSPKKKGSTAAALEIITDLMEKEKVETEIVHIGKTVQGCIACYTCRKEGRCVYDDIVNKCLVKLDSIDGIIISSPVYYAGIAGSMKSFLDRLFFAGGSGLLNCKAGLSLVVARRAGSVAALHQLNNYLQLSSAVIITSHYWNITFGNDGYISDDEEGIQTLELAAKNMIYVMKGLALAKQTLTLPVVKERVRTNFIR